MYEVEMFLGIVFICSMEYLVCVCAASLVGEGKMLRDEMEIW